jgi:hypothetical protein
MKANIYLDFPCNIYYEICIKDTYENISQLCKHFTRLYPEEKYEHIYKKECPKFTNMETNEEIDIIKEPSYRDNGFLEECNIKLNLKIIKK